MLRIILLSYLLFFSVSKSIAQINDGSTLYSASFQSCFYIGTVNEDWVISLSGDLTIELTRYVCSYVDRYNSLHQFVFVGKGFIKKDTLFVKWTQQDHSVAYRNCIPTPFLFSAKVKQYPPVNYFIRQGNTLLIPEFSMEKLSQNIEDIQLKLKTKFLLWGRAAM